MDAGAWGDDDDLPEDVLEECEIMASQALMGVAQQQQQHPPHPFQARWGRTPEVSLHQTIPASSSSIAAANGAESAAIVEQLARVREESEKQTGDIRQLKQQLSVKEGEIRILRETMARLESELYDTRQKHAQLLHKQAQEWNKREQCLRQESESVKTQLHFKEQECTQLQSKVHEVEHRLRIAAGSSSVASPLRVTASLKRRLPGDATTTPRDRGDAQAPRRNFPSKQSFHGAAAALARTLSSSVGTQSTSATRNGVPAGNAGRLAWRRHRLTLPLAGCGLTAQLLQLHPAVPPDQGPLGVLLARKPAQEAPGDAKTGEDARGVTGSRGLVDEGLTQLARHRCRPDGRSDSGISGSWCADASAVLLLPCIEEQLADAVGCMQARAERDTLRRAGSESGSSLGNKSSSFESTPESLSTTAGSREVDDDAGAEALTLPVLATLDRLTLGSCGVVNAILNGRVRCSNSGGGDDADGLASGGRETSSLLLRDRECGILAKLLLLVEPRSVGGTVLCPRVVEAALAALETLAACAGSQLVDRLRGAVSGGALAACLAVAGHPGVTLRALRLAHALLASRSVLALACTRSDACLLHLVYALCNGDAPAPAIAAAIVGLLGSVFRHVGGVRLLLRADCAYCGGEAAPALCALLCGALARGDDAVLRGGLTLLCALYACDPAELCPPLQPEHGECRTLVTALCARYASTPEVEILGRLCWDSDDDDDDDEGETDEAATMDAS